MFFILVTFLIAWYPSSLRYSTPFSHFWLEDEEENFDKTYNWTLSIITVLSASNHSLEFFANQLQTCTLFFDLNSIETWWVVVPQSRVELVKSFLIDQCSNHKRCAPWEVASEDIISVQFFFRFIIDPQRRHKFLKLAAYRLV